MPIAAARTAGGWKLLMISRYTRALWIVFLLCLLSACQNRGKAPPKVLLRVGNQSVTLKQFKEAFKKSLPADQSLSAKEKKDLERSFLVQTIDRELILAEATRLKITETPAEVDAALANYRRDYPAGAFQKMLKARGTTLEQWRSELEKALLIEKVVRQAVYSKVTVSKKEIADYYRKHRKQFDRPAQVRARQIVVKTEAEGRKVLGLLQQGESFAEVAKKYSLSPDSEQGGDLGFFARGEMPPEFDAVVFSLPVGKLSGLVKSEYGYHIFQVEEHRKAMRLSLDAVREQLTKKLQNQKEEQAYQQWLQDLRAKASIEVNWALLK